MSQPGATTGDVQASLIALRKWLGDNFKDPRLLAPRTVVSANAQYYSGASDTFVTLATTAAFTGFAQFGIQDGTDWTANTYKTIFSHTGFGRIFALVGPTAGGAETTTFEITIDGVLREITISNANTERAMLTLSDITNGADFTTANMASKTFGPLDASTLSTFQSTGVAIIQPSRYALQAGLPTLLYETSCLIRMKHSTSITNSTATSYSAVMVLKGIAA